MAKRVTLTPGTRWSASATDLSGNAPISVALIESMTVSAFRLRCRADSKALRTPVTTTSLASRPGVPAAPCEVPWPALPEAAVVCATAGVAQTQSAAIEAPASSTRRNRFELLIYTPLRPRHSYFHT